MSEIRTGGKNFPDYLPKVSTGDRITHANVNNLSGAVMRNSITSGVGVRVRRTASGTSIVVRKPDDEPFPFSVSTSGEKVVMYIGNIWCGLAGSRPANIDFDASGLTTPMPVGEFESDIASLEFPSSFPPLASWDFGGGDKMVWFEKDMSSPPKLMYTPMAAYDESTLVKVPVAFVTASKLVLQITKSDIWLDPSGLLSRTRHPFEVYKIGNGNYKVEQGMAFSYPNNFIDVGSGIYPNAIKIGATLGGDGTQYLLNESNLEFTASDGDTFFLMFTRDGVDATSDYEASRVGDYGGWKCTFERASAVPIDDIHGNYNTELVGACGDTMPACGPSTFVQVIANSTTPPPPTFVLNIPQTKRNVKFFSYGTVAYPVAKIVEGQVVQLLRSDFQFYPPLDARMSFTDIGGSTDLEPNSGLEPNTGLEPNP